MKYKERKPNRWVQRY